MASPQVDTGFTASLEEEKWRAAVDETENYIARIALAS